MKILIIGSGGREHALAWKIRQSPNVTKVYCAPGNPGIGEIADLVPLKASDTDLLLKFALEQGIDLAVVGPEQPLVNGIVDVFEENSLRIFGPSKSAAQIEGSKVFAKDFMKNHGIPTAEFRSFGPAERFDAERYIDEMPVPLVIKADGLAAGKGVLVCETKEAALEALASMMEKKVFGEAGASVVIEEYLVGEEASVLAITDGTDFLILPPAQDHKRILDGDQGKNTGGMGAFAPAPLVGAEMLETISREIIRPALQGMKMEGTPFKGCLFTGLMITETGPKVVEFNCRFGDPETQVILPLLESDILELLMGAASGTLSGVALKLKDAVSVCVIIGSGGYPDKYSTGMPILGLDRVTEEADVIVFHSGTSLEKGQTVTAGGRVVGITAFGPDQTGEATVDRAYRAVRKVTFDGAYYRSDIGRKAVMRLKKSLRAEVE